MHAIRDIESATGATIQEIDKLMQRQELRTEFPPSWRGRQRFYTRDNALELAFVCALTRLGMKPSTAVVYSDAFRRQMMQLGGSHSYFVFADGDAVTGFATHNSDISNIKKMLPGYDVYTIIDLKNIERRIDNVFKAEAEQA